ncbi:Protein phosphatase 1, regulatory subunit, and related proteins [Plasmopara halstedii]|uniref:Protein phosphatase 1, regulatory subunit, and related proteins n=1 Tax=Plasmopara halstedii TaxID=4781 RepID=A0A0P1ACU2_PLAHL|nr:Protein phosphatase 1, regulatory subunit, and related proteins [Plasmopara halstedii]CEG38279.1 Protein phosphatase 1, regulatory subunit, and related proteins [Plasmopara halstedii]|eukprot:XP_024574648.1 Protein phosphatase 1, regulatory subunit, and related proteins [Plasmopara halstedii]
MPCITVDLLRKRAEHNEGMISTLEEISLHQEELEKIQVIGTICRKLRILYLQNNIIDKIEDLTHLKELRYLNLALNNISKIEGLQNCEFLEKLDLTLNFVDFDTLEESIDHLKPLQHLRELYMLGNPCQSSWETGFREYVIAALPQIEILDGKEVQRSDRIKALQVFQHRQSYVRREATNVLSRKAQERAEDKAVIEVIGGTATDISEKRSVMASSEKVPYTPHTRREMYREMAEQKKETEARRRENQPRERNMEREHNLMLQKVREQEESADGTVRQCNEGKWDFQLMDEIFEIILEVHLPRFLDTSLIDVDVHPSYVSIVAKNKVFRLKFPELVHSDAGKAERSKTTGTLCLTLPKAHITSTQHLRAQFHCKGHKNKPETKKVTPVSKTVAKQIKISDELLEAAEKVSSEKCRTVNIHGLVKQNYNDDNLCHKQVQMTPVLTKVSAEDDDDSPPLVF